MSIDSDAFWDAQEKIERIALSSNLELLRSTANNLSGEERETFLCNCFIAGLQLKNWIFSSNCMTLGCKLSSLTPPHDSPFDLALMFMGDCPDIMRALCDYGQNVNQRGAANSTPLLRAVWLECASAVDALLEYGADVNATDQLDFTTALMYAAQRCDKTIVMSLLRANADVSLVNSCGRTASQLARESGCEEIANLIEHFKGQK